jgi:hypothetical protein
VSVGTDRSLKTVSFAAALIVLALAPAAASRAQKPGAAAASAPTIAVIRDVGCGCCLNWVSHLRQAGFAVIVRESAQRFTETRGVPPSLRSCHTGMVGGYMIEGHVPAADVQRLLKERPAIAGLAAPGMPMGSPGMEQGGRVDAYDVLAFDKAGKTSVYASHR